MSAPQPRPFRRAASVVAFAALATCAAPLAGCDPSALANVEETPQPPKAALSSVTLAEHPETASLVSYYCPMLTSATVCGLLFDPPPKKTDLKFSFETVFQLGNPNKFEVPLVELLIALKVYPDDPNPKKSELATLCVSFCDPAAEDCAARNPAEACKAPDKTVKSLSDFVPTVDDLVRLATAAANGTLDDNLKFRTIPARSFQRCRPAGTSCEVCADENAETAPDAGASGDAAAPERVCCDGADPIVLAAGCHLGQDDTGAACELCDGVVESHIRFDLGIDPITSVLAEVANESIDAISNGEMPSFDIPFSIEGTLFFDVPVLGRFALAFGPFQSTWSLD